MLAVVMGSAQSLGTVVNGMAGIYEVHHDGSNCVAWREEAEKICEARRVARAQRKKTGEAPPQENFNKNFYDNPNAKSLANDVKPEYPLAAQNPTTGEVEILILATSTS